LPHRRTDAAEVALGAGYRQAALFRQWKTANFTLPHFDIGDFWGSDFSVGGRRLSQCFQAVLFYDGWEFERHTAWALCAGLTFHFAFSGVLGRWGGIALGSFRAAAPGLLGFYYALSQDGVPCGDSVLGYFPAVPPGRFAY
jgi:hypothetical protein